MSRLASHYGLRDTHSARGARRIFYGTPKQRPCSRRRAKAGKAR
jgi:hypothetical protein